MLSCQGNKRSEPEACHKEEVAFFLKRIRHIAGKTLLRILKGEKPFIQLTLEKGSLAPNR